MMIGQPLKGKKVESEEAENPRNGKNRRDESDAAEFLYKRRASRLIDRERRKTPEKHLYCSTIAVYSHYAPGLYRAI